MLRFDWDDANREHLARHSVTPREAEEALNADTLELAAYEVAGEERLEELGMTDAGRILFLVTVVRGEQLRVVTAFDAARNQRLDFLAYHRGFYD
jgi:uncharacterized DUF497 family protein